MKTIESWPKATLALQSARPTPVAILSLCPSFNEDVEKLTNGLSGQNAHSLFGLSIDLDETENEESDALAREGFGRRADRNSSVILRPLTIETKLQHVKIGFNGLLRAGTALSEITSLAVLVSPLEHPKRILTQLLSENADEPSPTIAHAVSFDAIKTITKAHLAMAASLPPRPTRPVSR